jgi:serine/threonine protein kinase
VGSLVAGRFQVVEFIGEGAIGEVYVAEHCVLGRRYALKVLKTAVETDAVVVERFRREARAASRLDHPNIVYIADFGQMDDGRLYLTMEFTPGRELREEMNAWRPRRLPLERSYVILTQIADALAAAHEAGVVHRDLKPENILLCSDWSQGYQIKILDFGMAKIMGDSEECQLTKQGEIFGTPAFMAPEQASGSTVDHRTDIYTFGVLSFELCTGRLPFEYGNVVRMLRAHQRERPPYPSDCVPAGAAPLPAELERLILQCLEKDPARRPQNASEILSCLKVLTNERSSSVSHSSIRYVSIEALELDFESDWDDDTQLVAFVSQEGSSGDPQPLDDGANQGWYWNQVCKKSKELACTLRDQRLGTVELTRALSELSDVEEVVMSLETEIVLLKARQEDIETLTREREARLRNAVVDLSVERGRLLDEQSVDQRVIAALDYQILQLEQRIAGVIDEERAEIERIQEDLQQKRDRNVTHQAEQASAEVRLIKLLRRVKPVPCPPNLQKVYDSINGSLELFVRKKSQSNGA